MRLRSRHTRTLAVVAVAGVGIPLAMVTGSASPAQGKPAKPVLAFPTMKQLAKAHGEIEGGAYQQLRARYLESRYLAGAQPISPEAAAKYRAAAADKAGRTKHVSGAQPSSVAAAAVPSWKSIGPEPVVQFGRTTNSAQTVSGRISTLAVS